ncbi:hypothetical protein DFP72DRAFT_867945 [Ephemerocybe angulata]|uniref:Uncharacterized protein n=1 Tax=Ephemerocybe angulata TaxID=980116 RepID=A0A8H6MGD7_9AGAR|nr:hypothetical protein DFP72DRAFT_867945 [Tulosesus angulatus]
MSPRTKIIQSSQEDRNNQSFQGLDILADGASPKPTIVTSKAPISREEWENGLSDSDRRFLEIMRRGVAESGTSRPVAKAPDAVAFCRNVPSAAGSSSTELPSVDVVAPRSSSSKRPAAESLIEPITKVARATRSGGKNLQPRSRQSAAGRGAHPTHPCNFASQTTISLPPLPPATVSSPAQVKPTPSNKPVESTLTTAPLNQPTPSVANIANPVQHVAPAALDARQDEIPDDYTLENFIKEFNIAPALATKLERIGFDPCYELDPDPGMWTSLGLREPEYATLIRRHKILLGLTSRGRFSVDAGYFTAPTELLALSQNLLASLKLKENLWKKLEAGGFCVDDVETLKALADDAWAEAGISLYEKHLVLRALDRLTQAAPRRML